MNSSIKLTTLLLLILTFNGYAQVTKNLKMVWNDEFNGTQLDNKKWQPCPQWFRQGGSYWSDDNYELDGNGNLVLKVTEKNGKVYCGAIRTRGLFQKKYGYFEVRCKVPQMRGGWAAFWMMPLQNKPGSRGNDGTEIDIFESINGWDGKINHALHWDGYGAEHQKESYRFDRPDLYDNKHHLFGVMWTPNEYIFYIDNVETWRTSAGGVADVEQYLKLTMEVSDGWWAGKWSDQVKKPIYWEVDYVRAYDYQPVVNEAPKLSFTDLQSGQTYKTGENIKMHVNVTGDKSQIDEIKFFSQKNGGENKLAKTSAVTTENTYWHGWTPTETGNYTLKAAAYKNGNYVTNVVANVVVQSNNNQQDSFAMNYATLESGQIYTMGNTIKMDVILSGNLTEADQLQFLYQKSGGEFKTSTTKSITNATNYAHNWTPTEAGNYILKVMAFKNGAYVTHKSANITVEAQQQQDPFAMSYATLESGQTYKVGDAIKMDVVLSGNLSEANQLQFLYQKSGTEFKTSTTKSITNATSYAHNWNPTEAGSYILKVMAFKNGGYVTHKSANITVEAQQQQDSFAMSYAILESGQTYKVGDAIKMDVVLSGNLNDADELQFLYQKSGDEFKNSTTKSITNVTNYAHNWTPSEAGNYILKVMAFKNGAYITHKSVNITIEAQQDPLEITFKVLQNEQVYTVSDEVKMHVDLSGDFSQVDELRFYSQNGDADDVLLKKSTITTEVSYWYKWIPSQAGDYTLKVAAFKNDVYVTNVVVNIEVQPKEPLKISFKTLENGQIYSIDSEVKMDVELLGDISEINELRFISDKVGSSASVLKSSTVSNETTTYAHTWTPTEAGEYILKVNSFKNGVYVKTITASITIQESFQLNYTSLESGQTYKVNEGLNIGVNLLGDLSEADELQFLYQKSGNEFKISATTTITSAGTYSHTWTPSEIGNYIIKVMAFKNGTYITHKSVNISIEDPLEITFRVLENGQTYDIKSDIKMHVNLSGDLSQADELRFYSQKSGEDNVLLKTSPITTETAYWNKWSSSELGSYALKVSAFKDGKYVTNVVANIVVKEGVTGVVTNLQDQANSSTLLAYPNPTNGIVSLNIESAFHFVVTDLTGNVRLEGDCSVNNSSIDLSDVAQGNYLVKVIAQDQTHIFNITKY